MYRRSLVFILSALCGCYSYSTLEVHVTDAGTGKPVAKINVRASYERRSGTLRPKAGSAVTNADGLAQVQICTNYPGTHLAAIYFPGSGYMIDEATPRMAVLFATDSLHAHEKHRLDVKLLTWPEYRARYGDTSGGTKSGDR